MNIERIKKTEYLEFDDSEYDNSYTDDSGSNASHYSDSDISLQKFTQ